MTIKQYLKCGLSVAVGFVLSLFLTSDLTSDMILGLIGGSADFEVSDFYNRVDANRKEKSFNRDICVVNVDDLYRRDSIAYLIDEVAACRPRIIGIDLRFDTPKDSVYDSILCETLQRNKDIIVTGNYVESDGTDDFSIRDNILSDVLPSENFGAVNLIRVSPNGVIRSFRPGFKTGDDIIPSFATSIVKKLSPSQSLKAISQKDKDLPLRYSAEIYKCIDHKKISKERTYLKGKTVLIGTMNDSLDLHPTPISKDYPGVLIHAEIISTMLDGRYMFVMGNTFNWIIAILSAFMMCMVYVRLEENNAQNLILRLLMILVVAIGVIAGSVLYGRYNIYIDIVMIVLVIALSQFVLDVWYGIETAFDWIKTSKGLKKSAHVLAGILLTTSVNTAHATDQYTVYDVKGEVTKSKTGVTLKNGETVGSTVRLGMKKNKGLTLSESNGKLYITSTRDDTTPEEIVSIAKKQSKSTLKRIYEEVVNNYHNSGKKDISQSGASQRDEGDININTEFVYSSICEFMSSKLNNSHGNGLSMIAHRHGRTVWWSIVNDNDKPMFFNILYIPKTGSAPVFLFEGDPDTRTPAIGPESKLDLKADLYVFSEGRYLLICSEANFDANDINGFFDADEEPIPISDFNNRPKCHISDSITITPY